MTLPTIHLNGTSKDELLQQVCDANNALNAAISKLLEATPNARDYYPQGPDAFRSAQKEHHERYMRLQAVRGELEELACGIVDGGAKR